LDNLEQNINVAGNTAPTLQSNPGATVSVAQSGGNVAANAPATAHALQQANTGHAAAQIENSHPGILGSVLGFVHSGLHDLKQAGNDAYNEAMNVTIRAAQHEYRYLYSVYERHGIAAALGEGLVLAAGVAAGTALTGGVGDVLLEGVLGGVAEEGLGAAAGEAGAEVAGGAARSLVSRAASSGLRLVTRGPGRFSGNVLGAETATAGMGQVMDHDLWQKTENPNYRDPRTGRLVNFGNTLDGFLHIDPKSSLYHWVSGIGNAGFDLFTDPATAAGNLVGAARTVGLGGKLGQLRYVSRGNNANDILNIAHRDWAGQGDVYRAMKWIADANEGQILARYGRDLSTTYKDADGRTIVDALAQASTPEEVVDVFRNKAFAQQYLSEYLPSESLLHVPFRQLHELMSNAGGEDGRGVSKLKDALTAPIAKIDRGTTRVGSQLIDAAGKFAGSIDYGSQQSGHDIINFAHAIVGLNKNTAVNVGTLWARADVAGRRSIYTNLVNDAIMRAAGKEFDAAKYGRDSLDALDDPKLKAAVAAFIHRQVRADPGAAGEYTRNIYGDDGGTIIDGRTGNKYAAGVYLSQRGKALIPDFREIREMGNELSNAKFSRVMAGADDFLYDYVTNRFFKKAVLFSESYAEHIALSELLLNLPRTGLKNTIRAAVKGKFAGADWRVAHAAESKAQLAAMKEAGASTEELKAQKQIASKMNERTNRLEGFVVGIADRSPRLRKVLLGDGEQSEQMVRWLNMKLDSTEGHATSEALAGMHMMGEPGVALKRAAGNKARTLLGRLRAMSSPTHHQRQLMKQLDDFTTFGPGDPQHIVNWQVWLRRAAKDPVGNAAANAMLREVEHGSDERTILEKGQEAAREAIDSLPEDVRSTMSRSRDLPEGADQFSDPLDEWARKVAEDVQGATFSPRTRTPNPGLLEAVARGSGSKKSMVGYAKLSQIHELDRPLAVPGREVMPFLDHPISQLLEKGYQGFIFPTVKFMSRQPLFDEEYLHQMKALQPMVDAGLWTEDEQFVTAMARTNHALIKYVHNVHDRTLFDNVVSNLVPFFFAQEQAYRRMGRLLSTNPGAFRRYQLMLSSTVQYTQNLKDNQGNSYVALPGAGFLAGHAAGVMGGILGWGIFSPSTIGYAGNLSSAQVIFPMSDGIRPNFGPVAVIPAHYFQGLFQEMGHTAGLQTVAPKLNGALTWAVGEQNLSDPIIQQLIPNTALYRAYETAQGSDRSFTSTAIDTIQSLSTQDQIDYEDWVKGGKRGQAPNMLFWSVNDAGQLVPKNVTPIEQMKIIQRIKNQTRIAFVLRTALGFLSPLSAEITVKDYGLPEQLNADIKALGVSAGIRAFLTKNPDATAYSTFHSQTPAGATLPATEVAMNWVRDNMDKISQYQYGYTWLMPQSVQAGGAYSSSVYAEQIADNLRQYDTPLQFLTNLYASAGNSLYYNALSQHEAILKSTNKNGQSAEYARWDAQVQALAKANPVWANVFFSNQKLTNAQNAIAELQDIYSKGLAPDNDQAKLVKMVLDGYTQALYEFNQAGAQSNYASAQKAIRNQWEAQADAWAAQYPQLAPVIHSVFRDALVTQVSIA
jgi:hypothetical protein